ncbi:MAG: DUF2797 domain-containing protein [Bradymonadia bacterium]
MSDSMTLPLPLPPAGRPAGGPAARRTGPLLKMRAELDDTVRYLMRFDDPLPIHEHVGQWVELTFSGKIECTSCGRSIKKTYGEGACYPCFQKESQFSPCIIRPELCRGHLGEGRDPDWEAAHHVQPHVVYLAWTGALKVGVTRATNVPTRWLDQGAGAAIKLAEVPYRQLAGEIEVALKAHLSDRTQWKRMLAAGAPDVELVAEKRKYAALVPDHLQQWITDDDEITRPNYPLPKPPLKPTRISLDKTAKVEGILTGIRGQYLVFEGERAINVRRHAGYIVTCSV